VATAYPSVGILADTLARWTGGIDFLRMCVGAINAVSPESTQSVLVPSRSIQKSVLRTGKNGIKALIGRSITPWEPIPKGELVDALTVSGARIQIAEFRETRHALANALNKCGAEALLPCESSLGHSFPIPWVGYIPDLQHKQLPHFFSENEQRGRDKRNIRLLTDAPVLIVNARSVLGDIREFYPDLGPRLVALPFCPSWSLGRHSDSSAQETGARYRLSENYFIVSNQFWKHKSHETAFMAMRHLHDVGHNLHLVCTGKTTDSRWPDHFGFLEDLIQRIGLREYIHILGLIPKADQLAIMQRSLAVIQPTLFEGGPGGGAVYDAISLNLPAVVSDIPVNREIDIGTVRFFSAGSSEDLAEKLIDLLNDPPQQPSEEETRMRLHERQKELGKVLLETARSILN
jgi:glycosyltransferase involved in cell wall biosynthesis